MNTENKREYEYEPLATELLREVKLSAKRWFYAFLVMVALELATLIAFVWYATTPIESGYYIDQQASDRSFNLINGGDYTNGSETESVEIYTPSN